MRTGPLIIAIALFLALPLSLGAAIVLVPIGMAAWVVSARRAGWTLGEGPAGLTAALGVNLVLAFLFAASAAIVIHDALGSWGAVTRRHSGKRRPTWART